MIRMFVRHSVADFPRWKKAYDAFDAERKTMGVTGHAVYQTVGDPNEVTAWHDFQSEKAAHAFAESAPSRGDGFRRRGRLARALVCEARLTQRRESQPCRSGR